MSEIALFCLLHPASADKKNRLLSLLSSSEPYYRSTKAQCTTWTYFTPSLRRGAANVMVDTEAPGGKTLTVAGMEIYTEKSALQRQLDDDIFEPFRVAVKDGMYDKDEQLVAYYPQGGFVARKDTAPPHGKGTIVMIARFTCKEGMTEKAVEILKPFANWVRDNETDVLTYSVMTRPKAPTEILMFERYRNLKALGGHGSSKEFKAMFRSIKPFIDAAKTVMNEFEELDGSFVGNVVGGKESASAKL